MNKVLFKAAVILNIAAASLIYVACSGDDGEKGDPGAGCTAVASTVSPGNGFDIMCGSPATLYGTVLNGTAVAKGDPGDPGPKGDKGDQGNKGDDCRGDIVPGGIQITCGTTTIGTLTGGEGSGVLGDCISNPLLLNNGADKGIKITCASNGSNATIIICENATALHVNSDGEVGVCNAAGLVQRAGGVISGSLKCGGQSFNLATQFCQRVHASGPNAGKFANADANGTVTTDFTYPTTSDLIEDVTGTYNRTEAVATVTSTVKPLCGITNTRAPANNDYALRHVYDPSEPLRTVYNALEQCARDLVIDTNTYVIGSTTVGEPGGKLDIDPTKPYSTAWRVQQATMCFADPTRVLANPVADCATFMRALMTPYTHCADPANAVSIDDIGCATRAQCIIHSTIDNTCFVKADPVTVGLPGKITAGASSADAITGATFVVVNNATLKDKPLHIYTEDITVNQWSKACSTATRTSYYSVNDRNLVSKSIVDSLRKAFNIIGGGSITVNGRVPLTSGASAISGSWTSSISNPDWDLQPHCFVPNTATGTNPSNGKDAVAFEDALACLNGTLSINVPSNNGTSWDKPLICGTDVTSPLKNRQVCQNNGGRWDSEKLVVHTSATSFSTIDYLGTGIYLGVTGENLGGACVKDGATATNCTAQGINGVGGQWSYPYDAENSICYAFFGSPLSSGTTLVTGLTSNQCSEAGKTWSSGATANPATCTGGAWLTPAQVTAATVTTSGDANLNNVCSAGSAGLYQGSTAVNATCTGGTWETSEGLVTNPSDPNVGKHCIGGDFDNSTDPDVATCTGGTWETSEGLVSNSNDPNAGKHCIGGTFNDGAAVVATCTGGAWLTPAQVTAATVTTSGDANLNNVCSAGSAGLNPGNSVGTPGCTGTALDATSCSKITITGTTEKAVWGNLDGGTTNTCYFSAASSITTVQTEQCRNATGTIDKVKGACVIKDLDNVNQCRVKTTGLGLDGLSSQQRTPNVNSAGGNYFWDGGRVASPAFCRI